MPERLRAGLFGDRVRWSLRSQLVALTAVLASLVAIGLVVVVQLLLAGASNSAVSRVLHDRADTVVVSIDAASSGTTLSVPRRLLGPGVAVYDNQGSKVAGTVPPSMEEPFAQLSTTTADTLLEGGENYAILGQPFTTAQGTRGVVVLTEPFAPYENDERSVLVVSVVAGGLLVVVAAGSAAWISRRVLSPVEEMARTADEWSEHDLERRFDLGAPSNEIRALGNTLDGLLDKVAGVIKAEQRLTSELAHELRTPLTAIHGVAELLMMREDLDTGTRYDIAMIQGACESMASTITVLLDIAHREARGGLRERTAVVELEADLRSLPQAADVRVDLPADLVVDVPRPLVLRALAPVVANALKMSSDVSVEARYADRRVEFLVSDGGSGVEDESVDVLFTPGRSNTGGSGLGLSLARRVARSGGGDVTLVERHNASGGATFAVTFPGGPHARPPA